MEPFFGGLMSNTQFKEDDVVMCFCEEFEKMMEAQIYKLKEDTTQAYIHFVHQDKRLDKWVPVADLKTFTPSEDHLREEERVMSRYSRRLHEGSSEEEPMSSDVQKFEQLHKQVTKIRNIEKITIGEFTIQAWYFAPYPPPFDNMKHIYVCEYCWKYFATKEDLQRHYDETSEMKPRGREIYRKGNISIFELFGKRQKVDCQCLCLLAKLFLDHKTLFYDVEGFIFYVLCECDERGAHIAAYFSREVRSDEGNILACIVALPPYQKKGYGRLLISLSYELAKRQRISGGPERPLSDLGKIAFHNYWRDTLVDLLRNRWREIKSIEELKQLTAINSDDIVDVLKELNCVIKVKGEYDLNVNKDTLMAAAAELDAAKKKLCIDPHYLIWLPGDDDEVKHV